MLLDILTRMRFVTVTAAIVAAGAVSTVAQETTMPIPPRVRPAGHHKRHLLHPGIGSAASRNVGPSSTVGGVAQDGNYNAAAGNPMSPGAPDAGSVRGN
jgi:hypothetical protein